MGPILMQSVTKEDASLVQDTLAGNQLAFQLLVERYQRRAYAVAYGVLGDRDEAKDIVQEAFVRV